MNEPEELFASAPASEKTNSMLQPQPMHSSVHAGPASIDSTSIATSSRAHINYPKFWISIVVVGLAIICLFLASLSYLYGTLYNQNTRAHSLHILMVDFDGNGTIGTSMMSAYSNLSSPAFPTFVVQSPNDFRSPQDLVDIVREEKYWAAIYVTPGASQRLSAAIFGNLSRYDSSSALNYVWNEIRYPATTSSIVVPSLMQMVHETQGQYQIANAQHDLQVLSTVAVRNPTALQAFLNPIGSTAINIRPAAQNAKVFYNTISLAIPIVQMFFFLVAFNGISEESLLFTCASAKVAGFIRFIVGVLFTGTCALVTACYIWAFRESWAVGGREFTETWLLLWLLMHIYYLMWDCATAFLPLKGMPFVIITYLFLSIASVNSPFELMPGFYRWSQSLPAFETMQMLWNVWSGGSAKVYQALPILFSWWLVWMVLATMGFVQRRKTAAKGICI